MFHLHSELYEYLLFSIMKEHVLLNFKDGEVSVKPAVPGAKTKVNGLPLTGERVLKNNDRLLFGELCLVLNG